MGLPDLRRCTNRLFISRGNCVQGVNRKSGALLAEITDTPGVHGIALANQLDKGYTSNGRDDSVTVFAAGSLKTLTKIETTGRVGPG